VPRAVCTRLRRLVSLSTDIDFRFILDPTIVSA
jgi:hypothetical protein